VAGVVAGDGYLFESARREQRAHRLARSGHDFEREHPSADEDGTLRRDGGQPIQLIRLVPSEVGDHMLLLVNLNVPGVVCTTRISTTVLRIEGVDPRDLSY